MADKSVQEILLEQYKLYIEMMDRTSSRRIDTSKFYFAIITGLFALLPFVINETTMIPRSNSGIFVCLISVLVICLSVLWLINTISYRRINRAKFDVIEDMEDKLPYKCYSAEWERLKQYRYIPFSNIEQIVPILTAVIGVGLAIYGILLITG